MLLISVFSALSLCAPCVKIFLFLLQNKNAPAKARAFHHTD